MTAVAASTSLVRLAETGEWRTLGPGVRNREVVEPNSFADHSPFIVLVEDRVGPEADIHRHPHRGIETVTLLLDGALEHEDHTGDHGILRPGDVQWMTAGRGIMHGGKPLEGGSAHMLQLWLNLPARLKGSAPGTRVQAWAEAAFEERDGAVARIYGLPRGPGDAPWSVWPMTLSDIRLASGAGHALPVAPGVRLFLYVLDGEVQAGGGRLAAGQVGWLDPEAGARALALRATAPARLVAYAGQPIDEPVAARGPFVMTTDAEIDQAYADHRAGTIAT